MLLEELVHERENGEKYVKGRELHEYLEIGTRFDKWIPRMIEYGFEENKDFNLVKFDQVQKEGKRQVKRTVIDYELTLDMAKEISMIQRTDKGKEARNYFIDCEKYILESNQSPEFEYFRKTGKILRKDLTATIKNELNPNNHFIYSNYTDLVYKKVFGKKCKEIKEEKGLKKNDNLRDNLTPEELEKISKWENKVKSMIETFKLMGLDNKEIYSKIKELLGIK